MLLILILAAPLSEGILYPGVAPSNITFGENFITFVKIIDSTGKTITDAGSAVIANYSGAPAAMQLLNTRYAPFPGISDYWATTSEYSAGSGNIVSVNASYIDSQIGNTQEISSKNIIVGNLTIVFTSATNFNMTKKIGDILSIEAYLKDYSTSYPYTPPIAKMQYYIYDLKKMEVFEGPNNFYTCPYDGTKLCANHTLTQEHPAGIISLYATNNTDVGGKNLFFQAIPYSISPAINTSYPVLGGAVEINLNPDNTYGVVSDIKANITYPNGSYAVLPFSIDASKQPFYPPNISGDYTLNVSVNHTISGMTKYGAIFRINPAYIDSKTDKQTYKQGENVSFSAAVYDSNGTALKSSMNLTIYVPEGTSIAYGDGAIGSSGNSRSITYQIPTTANLGEYRITLDANDSNGRRYTKTTLFTVNALNKMIIASPSSIAYSFKNLSSVTYKINLTSNATTKINSITVSQSSGLAPYSALNLSNLSASLEQNASTSFEVRITPNVTFPEILDETVTVTFDGSTLIIPVIITSGLTISFDVKETYAIEVIEGKRQRAGIEIKNNGTGTMTNIGMSPSQNIVSYIEGTTIPTSIPSGGSATAYMDITIPKSGTYSGNIVFSAKKTANVSAALNLEAFEDFSSGIDTLSDLRKKLSTRALSLEANGKSVSSVNTQLNSLQEDISDLKSLYDNGKYSQSKTTLAELQLKAGEIQNAIESIETTPAVENPQTTVDGVCEETESCGSPDCIGDKRCDTNEKKTGVGTIIIIVIIVVLLVVVLATSIMPDETPEKS